MNIRNMTFVTNKHKRARKSLYHSKWSHTSLALDDAWEYESDRDFWSQSAHEQNQHTPLTWLD